MTPEDLEQYCDHLRDTIISQNGEIKALREMIQSSIYEIGKEIGKLDGKIEAIARELDEDVDIAEDMITNRDIDTPPVEAHKTIEPTGVLTYEVSKIYV